MKKMIALGIVAGLCFIGGDVMAETMTESMAGQEAMMQQMMQGQGQGQSFLPYQQQMQQMQMRRFQMAPGMQAGVPGGYGGSVQRPMSYPVGFRGPVQFRGGGQRQMPFSGGYGMMPSPRFGMRQGYGAAQGGGMMPFRMMSGPPMMGYGMMQQRSSATPGGFMIPQEVQKFLDETRELRREIHNKKFDYFEASRNAEANPEELARIEKELIDLRMRMFEISKK